MEEAQIKQIIERQPLYLSLIHIWTLKNAIAKLLAYRKNKKAAKAYVHPQGKQSVKKLIGQNQGVSSIELADGSIRDFEHVALSLIHI